MDRITWDQPDERTYESGVDRGVLYPPDVSGVPWNGLTSVEGDESSGDVSSYYFDGSKYLDTRSPSDFSATLKAMTYPDEFLEFDGVSEISSGGLFFDSQPVTKTFGLSYRTRIGDALSGNAGYKIHLAYNLTAKSDNKAFATIGGSASASDFSWTITGVPEVLGGIRPTAHVFLDSRKLDPDLLAGIEDILYGNAPNTGSTIDLLDGGTATSSITATGPIYVDAGRPGLSGGLPIIDGGTPLSSDTSGPVLGAPGPRLPPLSELVNIIVNWVPLTP